MTPGPSQPPTYILYIPLLESSQRCAAALNIIAIVLAISMRVLSTSVTFYAQTCNKAIGPTPEIFKNVVKAPISFYLLDTIAPPEILSW